MTVKNSYKFWIAISAAAVPLAFLVISGGLVSSASSETISSTEKAHAKEIALADDQVQNLIEGKNHRVVDIVKGDRFKGNSDYAVTIYVYPEARTIGVSVDLAANRVVEVVSADNTIGPRPSVEEVKVAYEIATADQRFIDLADGKKFTFHAHQIGKSLPDDPCHAHRCISISLDPIEADGNVTRHHSVFYIDLVSNEVNSVLLRPDNLNIIMPGQHFFEYDLEDFRGAAVSINDAQKAVEVFLQDQEIVDSLNDKVHFLLLSSDAPGKVTVSSDLMIDEAEFRNYVKATVNLEKSELETKTISPFTLEEINDALSIADQDSSVKEFVDNSSLYHVVVESATEGKLQITVHPLSGSSMEAVVNLQSNSVEEVK